MSVDALVIASYELSVPMGTIHVLRRILAHTRPGRYAVVARSGGRLATAEPPAGVLSLTIPAPRADWRGEHWMDLVSMASALPFVLEAVRRFRPRSLVSVFPFEGSLALGLATQKVTGLPLGAVFGDLYLENRDPSDWRFKLAGPLQRQLFSEIGTLGVLNEAMAHFYQEHYGLHPFVLPAPVAAWPSETAGLPNKDSVASASAPKPRIIGYSGSINLDREEGLGRLLDLIRDNPNYELRLFSQATPEYLKSRNLWASNVKLQFFNQDQALVDALAACDLLYVPLSFRAYRQVDQMRTCLGSKISDYLTTGVPILSHAPAGYWHAEFFRSHDCGLVVDQPDASALSEALERLFVDQELRQRLTQNAQTIAHSWSGQQVADRWDRMVERLLQH